MEQKQAIEQRISRRSFLQTPIEQQILRQLLEAIEEVNETSGLTVSYLEDGSDAFAGFKSYGMFDGVRAMLVLKGNRELAFLKEKVGYYGEQLILKATELGLGSCWVGGTFDRRSAVRGGKAGDAAGATGAHRQKHPEAGLYLCRGQNLCGSSG